MYDRDILKIKAYKSNDPNDWTQFKKLRNIVNSEISLAKQAYYQNSFNQYQAIQGRPGRLSMNLLHVNLGKQR